MFQNSYILDEELRSQYQRSTEVQKFIDLLVASTLKNIDNPILFTVYRPDVCEHIVKEFWLIGRVVVDFFKKDIFSVYNLQDVNIIPLPHRDSPKIVKGNVDVSDLTIFIRHSTNPYDWFGTSVLLRNEGVLQTLTNAAGIFSAALTRATFGRSVDGGFLK